MTTTNPTRGTYKTHGSPATFYYFGYHATTPRATGTLAKIAAGPGLHIVDAETGATLQFLARHNKIWASPAAPAAPIAPEYNAVADRLARVFG